MNQVVLVGKVVRIDKLAGILSVECRRDKEEGTDRIPIKLNEGILESVADLVKQGMTIGVKAKMIGKLLSLAELKKEKVLKKQLLGKRKKNPGIRI